MSSEALFQRFMEKAPVTVMVRSTLERVLSPVAIDAIFAKSAERQVEGELLFSSVVELLALVVWRQRDSLGQAYKQAQEDFTVSVRSVYNRSTGQRHRSAGPWYEKRPSRWPRSSPPWDRGASHNWPATARGSSTATTSPRPTIACKRC